MKLLLILLLVAPLTASADRIVRTTNGPVRGISLPQRNVDAFLGVPYAEPPVGPLRFARPVLKTPSEEVYDASELPPSCVQFFLGKFHFSPDEKMSEDCLHLNLWVPAGGSDSKPIMLFIHGGGFMLGSSNTKVYDGANLAEYGDVIVATINYRVGSLGFFTGFTDDAEGNMGLHDQVMAIKWIKENAKNFGGDPDNIVLFGESAGAFSVSLHMISPLSKDLFKRAILQSGSSASPMFSKNNGNKEISAAIASLLGCSDDTNTLKDNPRAVIDCMNNLPSEKFAEVDQILKKSNLLTLPRVGDDFLPEDALNLFKEGDFKDTELLLGVTRNEGTWLLSLMQPEVFGLFGEKAETMEFDETMARQLLKIFTQNDLGDFIGKSIDVYLDRAKKEQDYTYLQATADVIGDTVITCGAVFQADYHSLKDKPVYFYLFDYRSDSSLFADWMGVAHFDEIQYVFGNPFSGEFTEYEKEFSRDIMDMWISFAKTGNPSIPGGVKWPRYTYQDPRYLVLGKRDSVDVRPDASRCELWRGLFEAEIDENTIQS